MKHEKPVVASRHSSADHEYDRENRRSALRKLVVGGSALGVAAVLPEKWVKPVVNSALLPAHAQTTDGPGKIISDRAAKENFADVDRQQILEQLAALPVSYWSYRQSDSGGRHIGPMAQDFAAAFEVGDSDRHIHVVDANGVAMASIQALYGRLEAQDRQIGQLQAQLAELQAKLA